MRVGDENYHAGRRAVGTAYRDDSAPAVDAAVHPVGRVGGYSVAVQLSVNAPHGTVNVRSVPAQGIGGNADSVGIAVVGVNCVAEFDNAALGAGVGGLPLPAADGQRQLRIARNRYRLAKVRLQLQRLAQAVSVANQRRRCDMDAGNAGRNVEPAVHFVAAIVSQSVAAQIQVGVVSAGAADGCSVRQGQGIGGNADAVVIPVGRLHDVFKNQGCPGSPPVSGGAGNAANGERQRRGAADRHFAVEVNGHANDFAGAVSAFPLGRGKDAHAAHCRSGRYRAVNLVAVGIADCMAAQMTRRQAPAGAAPPDCASGQRVGGNADAVSIGILRRYRISEGEGSCISRPADKPRVPGGRGGTYVEAQTGVPAGSDRSAESHPHPNGFAGAVSVPGLRAGHDADGGYGDGYGRGNGNGGGGSAAAGHQMAGAGRFRRMAQIRRQPGSIRNRSPVQRQCVSRNADAVGVLIPRLHRVAESQRTSAAA